jgi:hypothetical protein
MCNARQNLDRIQERVGSTEVQRNRSVIRRLDSAYTFVAVMSFSQLADGPSDHELRRQDALAEGHSRMM